MIAPNIYQCDRRQSNIRLANKMQTHTPSQTEVLQWISLHLAQKLTQSVQNDDWAMVLAICSALTATLKCMEESGS